MKTQEIVRPLESFFRNNQLTYLYHQKPNNGARIGVQLYEQLNNQLRSRKRNNGSQLS